ncbi:tRNA synthetases class II-domain-containing protein [Xylaria intraflava]|nr:tRNA synthetases class II-domain-containing protein [Xylaria intraflava]
MPQVPTRMHQPRLWPIPNSDHAGAFKEGEKVVIHGYLGKRRDKAQNLSFFDLNIVNPTAGYIQIVSSWPSESTLEYDTHQILKSIPQYSPVCVTGILEERKVNKPDDQAPHSAPIDPLDLRATFGQYDLKLVSVKCLNPFPKDIIVSKDVVWPPKSRHLQMKFDPILSDRLKVRQAAVDSMRYYLRSGDFLEVETPILFKSTPEGAREFLVPTRRKGLAYALPQSPQQYKQILMASGIRKYYQFARCFRDEDHRADRQPEFTQLDLEMSFANAWDVSVVVQNLIKTTFNSLVTNRTAKRLLAHRDLRSHSAHLHRKTYSAVMTSHGTDKPDLRIQPPLVSPIANMTSAASDEFKDQITTLKNPIIETCKFRFHVRKEVSAQFIREFLDILPNTTHKLAGHSIPGVLFFDTSKPLQGLSALGHLGASKLTGLYANKKVACQDGDVILIHARKSGPPQGGATELGRLRKLIYDAAVEKGLFPKDDSLNFVWVTDFPLFTPNEGSELGDSPSLSATHHPFTAPSTSADLELLLTNPLKAKSGSYDLVLNGVEIGGGSRRIHVAELQEYVLRDVLKMTDEGVGRFSHLLEALRAGCPPHAGFALGLDRFIAVLFDVPSIRDVIAFPKDNKGDDKLVGSPSKMTPGQLKTYHLFTEAES